MARQLVILALILTGLLAWERWLVRGQERQRAESARVALLMPRDVFQDRAIAAVRIVNDRNEPLLFLFQDGLWRCLQAHLAPALGSTMQSLMNKLDIAEGVVQTRRPEDAASYGFDGPGMIRLALCGANVLSEIDGDVLFAIDIGRSIAATGGSYVRPAGTNEIWAVNVDLRPEVVAEEGSNLPPMLDPHIIPEAWRGTREGFRRIVIERAGGLPLVLARHDVQLTPEQRQQNMPPWQWTCSQGDDTRDADTMQLLNYSAFMVRAMYAGILAPRAAADFELDRPRAVVTIESAEAERLQLVFGGAGPRGGAIIFNTFTQVVFEVDPAISEAMLPDIAIFSGSEEGNPWEPLLRR